MFRHKAFPSIIDALELPNLVQLGPNLYGAAFFLMKLLPAHAILTRARAEGRIGPGSTVIETTSGTFGLGLAMICNQYGYRLILVSDPVIDAPFRRQLEDLGATVEIVAQPAAQGGYQQARLEYLYELLAAHPGSFWPSQYDNTDNPGAYEAVASQLQQALGQIDCLVGAVGSGGSMCGTGRVLRREMPDLFTIGVDTHGSVLFGQTDSPRLLRGLGNSVMPRNVDHQIFDEVHWVSAAEGFRATRLLHQRHALFMGPTSGAAYLVARWWAEQHPDATVVALMPDSGHRYQDTVYHDEWLRTSGAWLTQLPEQPVQVEHPAEAPDRWSSLCWSRRTIEEVLTVNCVADDVRTSHRLH